MSALNLQFEREAPEILCIGAHCDDIEIGCGGTLLQLADAHPNLIVHYVVFTGDDDRVSEARGAIGDIAGDCVRLHAFGFRDSYLPYEQSGPKDALKEIAASVNPDLILTHNRNDLHQDHRLVSELTWNLFRHHLIWEYEIPKFDGDLGQPNIFVPLSDDVMNRKITILRAHYASQASKAWFDESTFRAIARIRGMESVGDDKYAEAFYLRKGRIKIQ